MIGSHVLKLSKRNEMEMEEGKGDRVREFLDVFLTEQNGESGLINGYLNSKVGKI